MLAILQSVGEVVQAVDSPGGGSSIAHPAGIAGSTLDHVKLVRRAAVPPADLFEQLGHAP